MCGLFFIYKSKKTNAKLLSYAGAAGICQGLGWLGACSDFFTILLTGKNIDNSYGLRGILGYIWIPILALFLIYISSELLFPKQKWYILSVYFVLGIFFIIFILLDPTGSFTFIYPKSQGEDIIECQFTYGSTASTIYIIYFLSIISFWGFGFLYKSWISSSILKKKFRLLSIGLVYTILASLMDLFIGMFFISILSRALVITGVIFFYYGIKEEPEESLEKPPKKEIKVEQSLFRIEKRPDQITEEEISISKEKKICLVCKGKIGGLNFMCSECGAFYCVKCSEALTELENSCWACNAPIDSSKPVKPLTKEAENASIGIVEKLKKKQ
jgi:hypothetical protein